MLVDHLLKQRKNTKIYINRRFEVYLSKRTRLASYMTWLIGILSICLEEQLLIKYYMIKHLVWLKIQNMIDINVELLQWFIDFLIKSVKVVILKAKLS